MIKGFRGFKLGFCGNSYIHKLLGMGMVSMAIPIFTSTETGGSGSRVSERTEYYTTAKQLLSSGADAGERLMTAYKV